MKKTLSLLLTATLAAGLLAGCGGAGGASQAAAPADSGAAAEETAADGVAAAEGAATEGAEAEAAPADSKGTGGDKKITVGATPVPHADILDNAVKQVLAEEGWELETMVFEDYVLPNTSLESGELDANYFQTLGYMDQQNTDAGLHLSAIAGVHIEPMGIYSEKYKAISEIPDGGEIGIPNDPDNGERGLLLLVQKGLLNSIGDYGKDQNYTADTLSQDKEANPHGYKITPLEAASLPLSLPDLDAATINGNYALGASLPDKFPALEIEEFDDETSVKRTNFVVVRSGEEESEKSKALKAALQSDTVKAYIDDKYKGSVISSFIEPK
ncbi:MAG: ABC transporter substrate-binding protein [Lachnospiraceae bacterium]|nr:ABC transporter substrate-binding protein [Lachnospiraceae bacterium]